MKGLLILFCFCVSASNVYGQSLTFLDKESGQQVEGVAVLAKEITTGKTLNLISNKQGQVRFQNLQLPALIQVRHIAYGMLQDTLTTTQPITLKLLPSTSRLEDFVVTGQFNSQSASQSVFNVKVIDSDEIAARNAISLAEALNNTLNIRLSEDLAIGSTSASLLGVSGQNVKILIDGVPLVNRSGNGNNADLSQINLNLIERIEIVEGPMAVNYGANALAGVINLITKKEFSHASELKLSLQEESAGTEYGLDQGRHIQNMAFSHKLSPSFSLLFGVQRNDFSGFQGSAGPRQYEWNPKRQWQTNARINYTQDKFQAHYKLDYLNELITDFGRSQNNFLPGGENQPFAVDEEYLTQRYIHQVQYQGEINTKLRYNGFLSYSDFEREKTRFSKNLVTRAENLTTGEGDQDLSTYQVFEAGGTLSGTLSEKLDFQTGYQLTFETVGGGRIAESEQSIHDLALYGSLEWQPFKKLTLRPGLRLTENSAFGSQLIPSIQANYTTSNKISLRAAYGQGFRTPSVRELYFEFIDTNHRVFGNPNLTPEQSHFFNINVQKTFQLGAFSAKAIVNSFYNTIDDQIGLAQSAADATAVSYININEFKTLGATFTQQFESDRLSWSLGFSYIGRYNNLGEQNNDDLKRFFYTPEANTNFSYQLRSGLNINLFYKYSGSLQAYVNTDTPTGETETNIARIEGYHWMDLNFKKQINEAFDIGLGVRNLLDVQQINNSGIAGGAHGGGPNVPISYGRSYFIRLNYNLKIND